MAEQKTKNIDEELKSVREQKGVALARMQVPDGIYAGTRSRTVNLVLHPVVHQIDSGYDGERC